jgi:hypothetical protein
MDIRAEASEKLVPHWESVETVISRRSTGSNWAADGTF